MVGISSNTVTSKSKNNLKSSSKNSIIFLDLSGKNGLYPDQLEGWGWNIRTAADFHQANAALPGMNCSVGLIQLPYKLTSFVFDELETLLNDKRVAWIVLLPENCYENKKLLYLISRTCFDYHTLPVDLERLKIIIGHAIGMAELRQHGQKSTAIEHAECNLVAPPTQEQTVNEKVHKSAKVDTESANRHTGNTPAVHSSQDRIRFSNSIKAGLVALADAFVIFVTGLCLYLVYPGWSEAGSTLYLSAISIMTGFTLLVFFFAGLYEAHPQGYYKQPISMLIIVYSVLFLILIASTFALKNSEDFSRIWTFSWYFFSLLLLSQVRFFYHWLMDKWSKTGQLTRNIAIIGTLEQSVKLVEILRQSNEPYLRIAGIYDERRSRVPTAIHGYPINGNLDDLIEDVRNYRIDEVLIALPWSAEHRTLEIIERLKVIPVPVRLCPDMVGFNFRHHSFSYYNGIPVLNVRDRPINDWKGILKSIIDRTVAAVALLICLPLLLIIAVLIKLDSPGPVLFIQKRYGFNNQPFNILKFRSLRTDRQDDAAETLVTKSDPRVTRVGAFLRRLSLDELPQILNVLKGDMSIVGPRPHAMKAKAGGRYYQKVVVDYAARHNVKPGITGWAQVNGWRGETDTEEKILKRVEHDLFYIENWSIFLDIRIIFRTFLVLVEKENAY